MARMFTYFIQCNGDGGPIKIGRSGDVQRRRRDLQSQYPFTLRILGFIRGDYEKQFHKRFAAHRIRGEWFHAAPEILRLAALSVPLIAAESAKVGVVRAYVVDEVGALRRATG